MQKNTHIQTDDLTDVRNHLLVHCICMVCACMGALCAFLLLPGGLSIAASAQNQQANTRKASASSVQAATDVRAVELVARFSQAQSSTLSYSSSAGAGGTYTSIAEQAAVSVGIDPTMFVRQIQQESGFNPSAVSPSGAEGIAQFMPSTAAGMGVNPWNPTSALYGAARMMAQLKSQFGGNYEMALAAYNAGSGTVEYAISAGGSNWYACLPAQTKNYITIIMG